MQSKIAIMSRDFVRTSICTFLVTICFQSIAFAQGTTGTLRGQVVDELGSAVAGQTITISNPLTGQIRKVATGQSGRFQAQLVPGDYVLQSSGSGYTSIRVERVYVAVGGTVELTIPVAESAIDEIVVFGNAAPLMRTAVGENSTHFTLEEIEQLPVPRNIESVALLAPGTVPGIEAFSWGDWKTLVSFGGASVAENAYFIDGMNVSQVRAGLGGSSVPFEFYDQFQIKTGGYSAEFGRSTGGVINAVTRRGSNDFEFGVVSYFNPEWLHGTSPDTYRHGGALYDLNNIDRGKSWTVDMYAGGPIIKDRLFFFVLYEPQDFEATYMDRGDTDSLTKKRIADDFWGGNVTWNVNDNHSLSFTAFTDERDIARQLYAYEADNKSVGELIGDETFYFGGENHIVGYEGQVSDSLAVSALWGVNKNSLEVLTSNDADCPLVVDLTDTATSWLPGCWVASTGYIEFGEDQREVSRLDIAYTLGDHILRAGIDRETRESYHAAVFTGFDFTQDLPGGVFYLYQSWNVGDQLPNGAIVPDIHGDGSRVDTVGYRYDSYGGTFDSVTHAWYLEDIWELSDTVSISVGLRNEVFENYNADGDKFFDIDGQWAPRLALSWSPATSVEQTISLNWGRYHLPLTTHPLTLVGTRALSYQRWFVHDGNRNARTAAPVNVDANGVPTSGELGSVLQHADGSVPDTRAILDTDLEPMYQDEWIASYERRIGEHWLASIRYVNRKLKSLIEDVTTLAGLEAVGFPGATDWSQACSYVFTNPGTDITTYCDVDGVLQEVFLPADALGIPKAYRRYEAVELTAKKALSDRWMFQGSYTWSKNRGNVEGLVKSDIGQWFVHQNDDFNVPANMDGAYGYLPNDRRHKLRLWGLYEVTKRLTLSANVFAQSGRPVNAFGREHPDYAVPWPYDTFYLSQPDGSFEFKPRGTAGRTDWVTMVDLAAVYAFRWRDVATVELRAEVFNLFDADSATEVYEHLEQDPDLYKIPMHYQQPRQLRIGLAVRFE